MYTSQASWPACTPHTHVFYFRCALLFPVDNSIVYSFFSYSFVCLNPMFIASSLWITNFWFRSGRWVCWSHRLRSTTCCWLGFLKPTRLRFRTEFHPFSILSKVQTPLPACMCAFSLLLPRFGLSLTIHNKRKSSQRLQQRRGDSNWPSMILNVFVQLDSLDKSF